MNAKVVVDGVKLKLQKEGSRGGKFVVVGICPDCSASGRNPWPLGKVGLGSLD